MTTQSCSQDIRVGEGQFRYRVAVGWEKLPDGWSFVEAVGVAVDSQTGKGTGKGDILLFVEK